MSGECPSCHKPEDIVHALVTCELNIPFWKYFIWVIQKTYEVDITVTPSTLLKLNNENILDDILTLAFWSIYKLILLRNTKGRYYRCQRLKYIFAAEVRKRIEFNQNTNKMGRNPFELPEALLNIL